MHERHHEVSQPFSLSSLFSSSMFEEAVGEDCSTIAPCFAPRETIGGLICRCVCHLEVVHLEAHTYKTELLLDKYTHPNGRCFYKETAPVFFLGSPSRPPWLRSMPSVTCLFTHLLCQCWDSCHVAAVSRFRVYLTALP